MIVDASRPLGPYLPVPGYGFTSLEQGLLDLAEALVREPDPRALLERILREARRVTRAEAGTIFLCEDDRLEPATVQNDLLAERLGESEVRRLQRETVTLDQPSLAALVALSGQPLNIEDAYADHRGDPAEADASCGYPARSLLAVPLLTPDGRVLGVLQLVNAHAAPDVIVGFSSDDVAIARALAAMAAVVVHRARLDGREFRDPVTDLYTRPYVELRLAEERGRHERWGYPVSVVAVDVDGFRRVTERGAAAAERTLREVARVLRHQSRRFTVVARDHDDRFAVVLANTPREGGLAYAERMRAAIARHSFDGERLTASFGVAALGAGREAATPLLEAAGEAVDEAKRRGRNRVVAAE
ncbi:MAG TPA: sensor domain-containing diguanylate cyclase [Candidatus Tectomicrobia bacterium]|nr:sensor domain-containing diguanylate cyclase [Candidatus Tectomicrobia bacterium]